MTKPESMHTKNAAIPITSPAWQNRGTAGIIYGWLHDKSTGGKLGLCVSAIEKITSPRPSL